MKPQLASRPAEPSATGRPGAFHTPVRALRRRAAAARRHRRIRLLLAAIVPVLLLGCAAAAFGPWRGLPLIDAPIEIDPWPAPRTALASTARAAAPAPRRGTRANAVGRYAIARWAWRQALPRLESGAL